MEERKERKKENEIMRVRNQQMKMSETCFRVL